MIDRDEPLSRSIRTLSFWRQRAVEGVAAVAVVFLFTSALERREAAEREAVPASDWLVVDELFVPDHEIGTDPQIVYDKSSLTDFRAYWVAEVQSLSTKGVSTSCTGFGVNDYSPADVIPGDRVSWSWFLGRACPVPAGSYRIVASYDLRRAGYPVKRYRVSSNVFSVIDPDAPEDDERLQPGR